jgi:hypothetical protein
VGPFRLQTKKKQIYREGMQNMRANVFRLKKGAINRKKNNDNNK